MGTFLCTDKDQNVILGQCQEYVKQDGEQFNVKVEFIFSYSVVSASVSIFFTEVPSWATAFEVGSSDIPLWLQFLVDYRLNLRTHDMI